MEKAIGRKSMGVVSVGIMGKNYHREPKSLKYQHKYSNGVLALVLLTTVSLVGTAPGLFQASLLEDRLLGPVQRLAVLFALVLAHSSLLRPVVTTKPLAM